MEELLLVKLEVKVCNFIKINTPPWFFLTSFKLFKWHQMAQNITYVLSFLNPFHATSLILPLENIRKPLSWSILWKAFSQNALS